ILFNVPYTLIMLIHLYYIISVSKYSIVTVISKQCYDAGENLLLQITKQLYAGI
ncbi:hypothetical protein BgiBS90_036218, partial [Biomphalaria glabrata]